MESPRSEEQEASSREINEIHNKMVNMIAKRVGADSSNFADDQVSPIYFHLLQNEKLNNPNA